MRLVNKRQIAIVSGVLVAVAVLFLGTLSYSSVCVKCGRLRQSVSVLGFPWHSEKQSPFSQALDKRGLRKGHQHDWKFCSGAGGLTTCMIGPGRHVVGAVLSAHVAAFVLNAAEYDASHVETWIDALLSTGRGSALVPIFESFPENGFASREDFERWHDSSLEGVLDYSGAISRN